MRKFPLFILFACAGWLVCDGAGCEPFDPSSMSTTVSPATPATYPVSLSEPTAGDAVQSAQLRVNNGQALLNGVEAARLGLYGSTAQRRVICTADNSITIYPLGAVIATSSGNWTTVAHTTNSTFDPSSGLAASTRYWLYATIVAGVVTFVRTTVAPTIGVFYGASTDQLFISTFCTDSASHIVKYSQSGLEFVFFTRYPNAGADGNRVVSGSSAIGPTTVTLGTTSTGPVPPIARSATLRVNGSGPDEFLIYGQGNAQPNVDMLVAASTTGETATTLALLTANSFQFSVNGGVGSLIVDVEKFTL